MTNHTKEKTIEAEIADIVIEKVKPFVYDNNLYIYKSGVYNIKNQNDMLHELHNILQKDYLDKISISKQKKAVETIMAQAERLEELPRNHKLINFKNGVYDIDANKLTAHDSSYKMTYMLNANYNPEAKCERFTEFINNTFSNKKKQKPRKKLILNVQETCGYLISDYKPLKEFMFLYGESNTAKSAFAAIIRKIIGNKYTNSVDLKNLNQEYYLATMINKKLNICSDIGSAVLNDLSIIKQLTSSDDTIQIRQIRQATHMVSERPKLIFAGNHYPVLKSDVENLEAFFNRLHIIPFENVIPKENQIDGYSDILFEEADGIALWMLEGYKRFLNQGGKFTHCNRIAKYQNEYRYKYILPQIFVAECIEKSNKGKLFTHEIEKYIKWFCKCVHSDYIPQYLKQVRDILINMNIENKKIRKGSETKQGFYGVSFIYKKEVKRGQFVDFSDDDESNDEIAFAVI